MELPSYYVGVPIGEQEVGYAHVTIGLCKNCTPPEVEIIKAKMTQELSHLLPMTLYIAPDVKMFGHKKDIPVHSVIFVERAANDAVEAFYASTYRQEEGHKAHPVLAAHVSVDGEERKKTVKRILTQDFGIYKADRIELKKLGDNTVEFAVRAVE